MRSLKSESVRGIPLMGDESEETLREFLRRISAAVGFPLRDEFLPSVMVLGGNHRKPHQNNSNNNRRGFPPMLIRCISEPVRREFFVRYHAEPWQSHDGDSRLRHFHASFHCRQLDTNVRGDPAQGIGLQAERTDQGCLGQTWSCLRDDQRGL